MLTKYYGHLDYKRRPHAGIKTDCIQGVAVHSLSEASGDVYALGFTNHLCSVTIDMPLEEGPSSVRFRQGLL